MIYLTAEGWVGGWSGPLLRIRKTIDKKLPTWRLGAWRAPRGVLGELSGIPKVSWRIVKEHEEHLGGPGDSQEVVAVSKGCLGGVLRALGGCLGGV